MQKLTWLLLVLSSLAWGQNYNWPPISSFPSANIPLVGNEWTIVQQNGINSKVAVGNLNQVVYADISTSSSACTVNTNYQSFGFSSCARNSVGSYTITWSVTFPLKETCVVSPASIGLSFVNDAMDSVSSSTINTYNTSFSLADGLSFNIFCV